MVSYPVTTKINTIYGLSKINTLQVPDAHVSAVEGDGGQAAHGGSHSGGMRYPLSPLSISLFMSCISIAIRGRKMYSGQTLIAEF